MARLFEEDTAEVQYQCDTKSVSTLLASHFKLKVMPPTTIEESKYMSHVSYSSTVGCLMYAMVCTYLICLKLSQCLADTCTIPVRIIGR